MLQAGPSDVAVEGADEQTNLLSSAQQQEANLLDLGDDDSGPSTSGVAQGWGGWHGGWERGYCSRARRAQPASATARVQSSTGLSIRVDGGYLPRLLPPFQAAVLLI
jgi:hypothetical protein